MIPIEGEVWFIVVEPVFHRIEGVVEVVEEGGPKRAVGEVFQLEAVKDNVGGGFSERWVAKAAWKTSASRRRIMLVLMVDMG